MATCICVVQKNCGHDLSTHPDWVEAAWAIAAWIHLNTGIHPHRVCLQVTTNCRDLPPIAVVSVEGWTETEQRRAWEALDGFLHARWGHDCWVEKPWLRAWFHEHSDQIASRAA